MNSAGRLPARVAIIADVHADASALRRVLEQIDGADIDTTWCLGDFASDGPDPVACFELVFDRCDVILGGNHERFVYSEAWERYQGGWADAARQAAARLGPDRIERLRELPEHLVLPPVELVHGALTNPIGGFIGTAADAVENSNILEQQILLCGHSHRAACWSLIDGNAVDLRPAPGTVETASNDAGRWILNPGAVADPAGPRWLELDFGDGRPRFSWHQVAPAKLAPQL